MLAYLFMKSLQGKIFNSFIAFVIGWENVDTQEIIMTSPVKECIGKQFCKTRGESKQENLNGGN